MTFKKKEEVQEEPQKEQVEVNEISQALVQSMDMKSLPKQIEATEQAFKLMGDFIKRNLKAGIDYGVIEYTKKDGTPVKTKPFLHKPGSEKFTILFGHRPTFKWIMQDFDKGIFAVKCYLLSKKGKEIVGEGVGSAKTAENQRWTENEAMKMAEKRAQIDAALRTYGLSEYFTQDEEVMTRKPSVSTPSKNYQPRATSARTGQFQMREDGSPITQNQMNMIFGSSERLGHDKAWLENWIYSQKQVQGVENLTKFQASKFIDALLQQEAKQKSNIKRTFQPRPTEDMPTIEYEDAPIEEMPGDEPKEMNEPEIGGHVEDPALQDEDDPLADL